MRLDRIQRLVTHQARVACTLGDTLVRKLRGTLPGRGASGGGQQKHNAPVALSSTVAAG
jgi:hypothetical protein